MNKRGAATIFSAVIFALLFSSAANAENLPKFDDSSVMVVTKSERSSMELFSVGESFDDVLARLGITETEELMDLSGSTSGISLFSESGGSIIKLTLPKAGEDKVLETVDALNASGTVKYAEPNYYYYLDAMPDDSEYLSEDAAKTYRFSIINAEKVWEKDIDCSGVTVAVIDSGIFAEHEDLKDNIWTNPNETDNNYDDDNNKYKDDIHGWDFTGNGDNIPDDGYDPNYGMQGHGTHVSGIISAVTGNDKGIASLAGNINTGSAKIVPLKVFYDSGTGKASSADMIVDAINYVKQMNIPIANCSWGNSKDVVSINEAIKSCSGTLFVAAAGNGNENNSGGLNLDKTSVYPAKYKFDNVIAVGASTADDKLAVFSNYGNLVDIAAPGVKIWSTANTNLKKDSYEFMSGTSQATPLAASMAAVLKGKYPSLTPAEIKDCIINGASSVTSLTYSNHHINGNRRLSMGGALKYAEGNVCEITWKGENGNIIKTDKASYGEIPEYNGLYEKKFPDGYYAYVPAWEPEITEVVGDAEYTMKYVLADMLDMSVRLTGDNDTAVQKGHSPQHVTAYIDFPNAVTGLAEKYALQVEPFTLILALYDENGALVGMAEKTVGGDDMLDTVTLNADLNNAVYSARIYIWNKTDSMLPIRNAKDVL